MMDVIKDQISSIHGRKNKPRIAIGGMDSRSNPLKPALDFRFRLDVWWWYLLISFLHLNTAIKNHKILTSFSLNIYDRRIKFVQIDE